MARRGSSIGFLGRFGRSSDLRQLDDALRPVGLHRAVVPEAVKLAMTGLMKDALGDEPPAPAYPHAAALLAYCMLGADGFAEASGIAALELVETRVTQAIEAGDGLDAGIVLLAHHAGLLQPSVVARHGLEFDAR